MDTEVRLCYSHRYRESYPSPSVSGDRPWPFLSQKPFPVLNIPGACDYRGASADIRFIIARTVHVGSSLENLLCGLPV